jgi:hypothetical protein
MTEEWGVASTGNGERRSGEDRRKPEKRPGFRYLLMGRRRRPRRTQDPRTDVYVEVYGIKIFLASLSLIVLSVTDALFTLYHIERGAKEVNPTMNLLLEMGVDAFFYMKYALTCLAVLFLCVHKNFSWVRQTIVALILVYILVISWHLYLLAVY